MLLCAAPLGAQAPQSFNYQSIIRDGSGELVTDQQVGVQISILQGSALGMAVYEETHSPSTNLNGLATLTIGEGTPVTGIFSDIDWAAGPYFLKTETDPTGETSYSISSISQLLSVPYALFAENVLNSPTNPPAAVSSVFTDEDNRTLTSNTWILGPTFPVVNGFKSGSKVRIDYSVPSRTTASSNPNVYLSIEPQVSFDGGSWQSLGSSGFSALSGRSSTPNLYGNYANTLLIDPGLSDDYSVQLRLFYLRSAASGSDGWIQINQSQGINNISGSAPLMSDVNGTQHFTKVIITEVP